MGCSHNYVYTRGYFTCTRCGKRSYGRSYRKKQGKKAAVGIIIGLVAVFGIFAFTNGYFDNLSTNTLEESIKKIPDSIPDKVIDDTTNAISKIEIPKEVKIPEVKITSPLRVESGFDSSVIEQYIYEFTNNERQNYGKSNLNRISAIDSIARNHSQDMANRNYFSHDTPDGLDPTDRGNRAGYNCQKNYGSYYSIGLAENIYQSYTYSSYMTKGIKSSYTWMADEETLAKQIVDGWMDSPGHRQNILESKYDRIGVGVAINDDEVVYSTQNFC